MDMLYVVRIGYNVGICCRVLKSHNFWCNDFLVCGGQYFWKYHVSGLVWLKQDDR